MDQILGIIIVCASMVFVIWLKWPRKARTRVHTYRKVAIVAGLTSIVSPLVAETVTVDGGIDVLSQYVNRGYVVADELVVQPSLALAFAEADLKLGVWGSLPTSKRSILDVTDQLNVTLDYTRRLEAGPRTYVVRAGYTQYTFPRASSGARHSEEFYGGFGMRNALNPMATVYYDFGLADGFYATASLAPVIYTDRHSDFDVEMSVLAAFSEASGRALGFHNLAVGLNGSLNRGPVSFGPAVEYVYADDNVNPSNHAFRGGLKVRVRM